MSAQSLDAKTTLIWWLVAFRKQAESDAGAPCHAITTSLGLALFDICRALGLDDEQTRLVIGDAAYQAICEAPIPFTLDQEVDHVQQAAVSR